MKLWQISVTLLQERTGPLREAHCEQTMQTSGSNEQAELRHRHEQDSQRHRYLAKSILGRHGSASSKGAGVHRVEAHLPGEPALVQAAVSAHLPALPQLCSASPTLPRLRTGHSHA